MITHGTAHGSFCIAPNVILIVLITTAGGSLIARTDGSTTLISLDNVDSRNVFFI